MTYLFTLDYIDLRFYLESFIWKGTGRMNLVIHNDYLCGPFKDIKSFSAQLPLTF